LKKIGLIINPIAGMGGSVGLKGTDGVSSKAKSMGAVPKSAERTALALEALIEMKEQLQVIAGHGPMGEDVARELGFPVRTVGRAFGGETTSADTMIAAEKMAEEKVDLLMFAGGDGTARDIYSAVKDRLTVVGIPAGVKIHSAAYAINPRKAGDLAKKFLLADSASTNEVEVIDIDEEAFRRESVKTKLFGYLKTPAEKNFLQVKKASSIKSDEQAQWDIAHFIVENMEKDTFYIIGPGSTTRPIMQLLNLPYTLLGVDLIYNKKLVKNDVAEQELLDTLFGCCKIIITPIGGQGYLLGRGNQQISAKVVERVGKANIIVVSTRSKLQKLKGKPFLVDTNDASLDKALEGYVGVITGFREKVMNKIGF